MLRSAKAGSLEAEALKRPRPECNQLGGVDEAGEVHVDAARQAGVRCCVRCCCTGIGYGDAARLYTTVADTVAEAAVTSGYLVSSPSVPTQGGCRARSSGRYRCLSARRARQEGQLLFWCLTSRAFPLRTCRGTSLPCEDSTCRRWHLILNGRRLFDLLASQAEGSSRPARSLAHHPTCSCAAISCSSSKTPKPRPVH